MQIKRWLKRLFVATIGSLVIYTLFLIIQREVHRHRGTRELEAAIAEADAADPRWRWDAIQADRPRPPEEQNAAPLISKIKAAMPADTDKQFEELADTGTLDLPANVRLPERILKQAQDCLAPAGEALLLARTLKDRPRGFRAIELAQNPLDTLLPDAQHTREVANLLRWNLWVAVENQDYEHAAEDLLAALNTSRSIGDESFLISQLVRIATRAVMVQALERVIAQTEKPTDLAALKLAALQAALAQDAEEPLLLYGLRGDRAAFDTLLQRLGDGTLDLGQIGGSRNPDRSLSARVGWWLYGGRHPADRAFCLRWFNAAVEMAQKPLHEQPAAFEALIPMVKEAPKEYILTRLLLPAVDKVAAAHWRSVALARCAVVGIACERFRLRQGRWPESLAELCPEFLSEVPLDPFDGQPLRFAKQEDGVVVHSVALNPLIPPSMPKGIARPHRHAGLPEGIEIGFRLWNPDQRRLPPPPEPPKRDDEDRP